MADAAAQAAAAAVAALEAATRETRLRAAAARISDAAAARKVAQLLDAGVDVNAPDAGGRTALHFAVDAGNVAAATLLLNRGADVAAATRNAPNGEHECNDAAQLKPCA